MREAKLQSLTAKILGLSPFDDSIHSMTDLQMMWIVENKISELGLNFENSNHVYDPEFDKKFNAAMEGKK